MRRFLHIFVLTPAEQFVVIVLVLLLVLGAGYKYYRDIPRPDGAAISPAAAGPSN